MSKLDLWEAFLEEHGISYAYLGGGDYAISFDDTQEG